MDSLCVAPLPFAASTHVDTGGGGMGAQKRDGCLLSPWWWGGNQVQEGDKRQSSRVDGDTWAEPGNGLMCEATVCGGVGK